MDKRFDFWFDRLHELCYDNNTCAEGKSFGRNEELDKGTD